MNDRNRWEDPGREYSWEMTALTGEYIDQFTTVPDLRTTDEILSRVPNFCKRQKCLPLPPIDTKPFREVDKIVAHIQRATNLRTGREPHEENKTSS